MIIARRKATISRRLIVYGVLAFDIQPFFTTKPIAQIFQKLLTFGKLQWIF
jgi:hypothetical protein